jgi:hypothetical protein
MLLSSISESEYLIRRQSSRMEQSEIFGYLKRNTLAGCEWLSERRADLCVLDGLVEALERGADAGERDERPVEVESLQGANETCAFFADLVVDGHAHFVEEERAALMQESAPAPVDPA